LASVVDKQGSQDNQDKGDTEHSHKGEQGIHTQDNQDWGDMPVQDIDPVAIVALDMAEVAAHLVAAPDTPVSALHTHYFVEQKRYLFQVVAALHLLAGEAHMVSKPDETTASLMDRQVKR
jgi:hypothetical protein